MTPMVQRGGYRRVSVNSMLKSRDSDWGSKKKNLNFLLTVPPPLPSCNRRTGWNSTVVYALVSVHTKHVCVCIPTKKRHTQWRLYFIRVCRPVEDFIFT